MAGREGKGTWHVKGDQRARPLFRCQSCRKAPGAHAAPTSHACLPGELSYPGRDRDREGEGRAEADMRRGRAAYAAAGRRVMCVHRTAAGAACWLGVGWGRERADAPSILQRLGIGLYAVRRASR
jgi:hypothetical protein